MRATKEYRLSCTEEAKKIVDRLTLEQKVWLMSGNIDITRMRQEDMAQMMEAMQDDSKHYNVTPYAAGGLEEEKVPPMLFVDGPRAVSYTHLFLRHAVGNEIFNKSRQYGRSADPGKGIYGNRTAVFQVIHGFLRDPSGKIKGVKEIVNNGKNHKRPPFAVQLRLDKAQPTEKRGFLPVPEKPPKKRYGGKDKQIYGRC